MSRGSTGKGTKKKRKKKGKQKQARTGPVRAVWRRWKAWRATHRSHRLTTRITNACTLATLAYFLVLCYIAGAWAPGVVAESGHANAAWSQELESHHDILIIQVDLERVPGDVQWNWDPRGPMTPSVSSPTWPGVEWRLERAETNETVAVGSLSGSWNTTDTVRLPDPGTYLLMVVPVGDQGEAGFSVTVWEARLDPDTKDVMAMFFFFALSVFISITGVTLLFWNRRFPDEYRWTLYMLVCYAIMVLGTNYYMTPHFMAWPG